MYCCAKALFLLVAASGAALLAYTNAGASELGGFRCSDNEPVAEWREPGGQPEHTEMAIFRPDDYAWTLFLELNRQANSGKPGKPDLSRNDLRDYEHDIPVLWETWAHASGNSAEKCIMDGETYCKNRSEVFYPDARKPVPWDKLAKQRRGRLEEAHGHKVGVRRASAKSLERSTKGFLFLSEDNAIDEINELSVRESFVEKAFGSDGVREDSKVAIPCGPPSDMDENLHLITREETLFNRSVYDLIRDSDLYSVEGIESAYRYARDNHLDHIVEFDQSAKLIKSSWARICDTDKPRYHWREVDQGEDEEKTEVWGLVAVHIMTKDSPDWFWCTFVHADWQWVPGSDLATTDTGGVHPKTMGSKWAHYRLHGTQTTPLDSRGRPRVLANPVIESPALGSSCISCHARSAVALYEEGAIRERRRLFKAVGSMHALSRAPFVKGLVSAEFPSEDEFEYWPCQDENEPTRDYLQADYVWSILMRAHSRNPKRRDDSCD